MSAAKKTLLLTRKGAGAQAPVRVAYYVGASPAAIAQAIASALDIAAADRDRMQVRDADGDVIALADSLPDGVTLSVEISPGGGDVTQPATGTAPTPTIPPGPRPLPLIGNLRELRSDDFLKSLGELIKKYGPFVGLRFPILTVYLVSDPDALSDMLARPDDFPKLTTGERSPLGHLRTYNVGDALFTANDTEEIWHVAHRILLPTMGANAIKQYYPKMLEIADVLLAQLGKLAPGEAFLATDLMTRMTFETIAYTGFNTRYHCLETTESIPFLDAMVEALTSAMHTPANLLPPLFHPIESHRRDRAASILADTVDRIIADRKAALERGESVPNDILQTMLTSRDRVTGRRLPDENIRHQLITFLIAGHETTSGLLSYALYYISRNPDVEAHLMEEIDRVLGRDYSRAPTFADIERLDYTNRILKETLRLAPTAPGFNRTIARDTVVAGRYVVSKGSRILVWLAALHRNAQHWGDDPEQFDPDRFLPAAEAARHPDAYHPFGMGMRSCIGFQFALVEARLVLALIYQRYRVRTHNPQYQLAHVQTLTVKPKDLHMVLEARAEEKGRLPTPSAEATMGAGPRTAWDTAGAAAPFFVLYGSNMGTCVDLAQNIARQAARSGYSPQVAELDRFASTAALRAIGTAPLVIVTSTYNGNPPDNAEAFCRYLSDGALSPDTLRGLRYAVLGCGNKQWRTTYQKVPRMLDGRLRELGAEPFVGAGSCDADGDLDASAEAWQRTLHAAVAAQFAQPPVASQGADAPQAGTQARPSTDPVELYAVDIVNFAGTQARAVLPHKYPLHDEAWLGVIVQNVELQSAQSDRSTRHIEIELPEGVRYSAGDHLGVFPENPHDLVRAVAARCGVRSSDVVVLRELAPMAGPASRDGDSTATHLPTGVPITVHDLLTYHLDLSGPLTRRELRALAERCPCPPEQAQLVQLAGEAGFKSGVLDARRTLLDVLTRFASVPCPLPLLLSLRPLLKPRYYSISSSPRVLPHACTITVGVHTFTGLEDEARAGLCSHFLARSAAGTQVRMLIKDTRSSFRLPADPATDIILIGPGTGIAPLRGFVQERAAQRQQAARTSPPSAVGKTLLFFGCRRPDHDYIYRAELDAHVAAGDLDGLHVAFSREPGKPRVYVQDLLRAQADQILPLLDRGARIYVCGDAKGMAPDVQGVLADLLAQHQKVSRADADAMLERWKQDGRYLQDVWAST